MRARKKQFPIILPEIDTRHPDAIHVERVEVSADVPNPLVN
jgi:hypothetical protein